MKTYKQNPIPEILSTWEWDMLNRKKLLNHTAIRDYKIRKEVEGIKRIPDSLIGDIAVKFGIKKDSIRKIIYKKN